MALQGVTAQVLALTEGRQVQPEVLAALVAAVRGTREAAGTLGAVLRGAQLPWCR